MLRSLALPSKFKCRRQLEGKKRALFVDEASYLNIFFSNQSRINKTLVSKVPMHEKRREGIIDFVSEE
jgi:hypothetical protein